MEQVFESRLSKQRTVYLYSITEKRINAFSFGEQHSRFKKAARSSRAMTTEIKTLQM
jgi:hypothetical protein